MITNREFSYRTINQIVDAASIDLRSYYSDGIIEIAELIQIVQEINWELGIQIQQTKETVLDIDNGRTKLPNDFDFLNFGAICTQYTQYYNFQPPVKYEVPFAIPQPGVQTVPCWNVTSYGAQVKVIQPDGTETGMFFPANDDGSPRTVQVCLINIDLNSVAGYLTAQTTSNCFPDPNDRFICGNAPQSCGCTQPVHTCGTMNADPWNQSNVYTLCNNTKGVEIVQKCETQTLHYRCTQPLYMQPSRRSSAFCSNSNMKSCAVNAFLRDGFLITPNLNCGTIYINYQGLLQDEQGALLAIDHPKLNQYYNYAVKERILENLYLNGEPDIERRLQMVQQKKKEYKGEAMVLAYTPDFRTVCDTFKRLRQIENEKHIAPFSRYTGVNGFTSWVDALVNGRYRDS